VEYMEELIDNVLYRELRHIVDYGTPEKDFEDGNWKNYDQGEQGFGPVFINTYTYTRSGGGNRQDEPDNSGKDIPDIQPPREEEPEIPEDVTFGIDEEITEEITDDGFMDTSDEITITADEIPVAAMPRTGLTDDMLWLWLSILCYFGLAAGMLCIIIDGEKEKTKRKG